jgi:ABC-2 type transport system permease protein
MTRLIRTEILKLRTTRTVYGLLLATLGLTALSVLANVRSTHHGAITVKDILGGYGAIAAIPSLILGVLAVSNEVRHRTITTTLLSVPVRWKLILAKLAAISGAALVFGVLASALNFAVGLPWLASHHIHASLFSHDVVMVTLGATLTVLLYALAGVGIGALITNQMVAVGISVVFVLVGQSLIGSLFPALAKWLPGGAAYALSSVPNLSLLPMWGGGLLLAGYGVAFAATGAWSLARRDID